MNEYDTYEPTAEDWADFMKWCAEETLREFEDTGYHCRDTARFNVLAAHNCL